MRGSRLLVWRQAQEKGSRYLLSRVTSQARAWFPKFLPKALSAASHAGFAAARRSREQACLNKPPRIYLGSAGRCGMLRERGAGRGLAATSSLGEVHT